MKINRRDFLNSASEAGAAFLWLGGGGEAARRKTSLTPAELPRVDCGLADIGPECTLPESRAGYAAALTQARIPFRHLPAPDFSDCRWVVVSACGTANDSLARRLETFLRAGGQLLFESGAGFLDSQELDAHRNFLQARLGVGSEPPRDLWRHPAQHRHTLYVDYDWPVKAKVRDFSRVLPLAPEGAEVIGRIRTMPVAIKRKVGKGTLVFLGSPLGPHLLADDPAARFWLQSLVTSD